MLDSHVVKIAEERVQLEITEQTETMHREIKKIQAEAAMKGLGRSSSLLNGINDLCIFTIKNRAQMAWQIYHRFLTTAGISYSDTLVDELKYLVAKHLPEDMFKNLMKQQAELIGMPNLYLNYESSFDAARKTALRKVNTEIDLFVSFLKNKTEIIEKGIISTVFNIYSPIGAIQTGDSSIANVTQTIDPDIKEKLIDILKEISTRLIQTEVKMQFPKEDIIDIVNEGREELLKQSLNVTKLRTLLSTIGTAIQTTASLKQAYESLKWALTFFGVSLP